MNRKEEQPGGGTQLWVTRHVPPKRPCFFSLALTERPPFLPTFTQWPPIFRKFQHFWWNVEKFLAILTLKAPIFWCISLKDLLFLCALSLKDPLFWHNLSPKDPYIWSAWWHSYVTFICECPPPPGTSRSIFLWLCSRTECVPIPMGIKQIWCNNMQPWQKPVQL